MAVKEPTCSNPTCGAPSTLCLGLGVDLHQCPFFQEGTKKQPEQLEAAATEKGATRPSWSGLPFTPSAAHVVSGEHRPWVFGLIGLSGAGKTSFLATLYQLLKHRQSIANHSFAGSYTLTGWETIAANLNWKGKVAPTYPPRTTGHGREPGLLHLALRSSQGRLQDVLITDVPGEWFRAWTEQEQGSEAEGARWIATHADGFLLCIDGAGLSTAPDRHTIKRQTQLLVQRMQDRLNNRPLVVVWTKHDATEPSAHVTTLQNKLDSAFGEGHSAFHTISAISSRDHQGQHVMEVLSELLERLNSASTTTEVKEDRAALLATLVRRNHV